jgi:hypothetical protein
LLSTTVLTVDNDPAAVGTPVTFTADVVSDDTAAPQLAGTVTFQEGRIILGTVPVSGNLWASIDFTTSALAVGSHTITATYHTTDPNDSDSTSDPLTAVITPPNGQVPAGSSSPLDVTSLNDVSSQVSVARVRPGRHAHVHPLVQELTLKNTGDTPIAGPLFVVVHGLPSKVKLRNATGTTASSAPAGDPFVELNVSQLAPGASARVTLRFVNPKHQTLHFTTMVLADAGGF